MVQALYVMKSGKAPGHSDVSLVLLAASREVGIQAMDLECQLNGL